MTPGTGGDRRWQWGNVPLPRSHLAALAAGLVLQRVRPRTLPIPRRPSVAVGLVSVCLSVLVAAWSVLAMGRVVSDDPVRVVDRGPYGRSRNPTYVAWTGLYLGLALLLRSFWLLLLTPAVAVAVHRAVLREEAALERSLGEPYRGYRASVPRHL
jgi:protein-S-isoprenylcysteine O-methyltransferase Ste14